MTTDIDKPGAGAGRRSVDIDRPQVTFATDAGDVVRRQGRQPRRSTAGEVLAIVGESAAARP